MEILSPAFEESQPIPKKYSCEGENVSPPLNFGDIPVGTKSLALIVEDPDAPNGTFDHWVVWNLDPVDELDEDTSIRMNQGENGFGVTEYKGPCPPAGKSHRYYFKVYALDMKLDLQDGASKDELLNAMEGHIIGNAKLMGTYKRG